MTLWLLIVSLALVILPLGYVTLCVWMLRRKTWWFTYLAYFFVFGSFGGWCLMIAMAFTGPGGGTVLALGMEVFLLTCAMAACLISSVVLQFRREKDRFARGAMVGGYSFVVLHSAFFSIILYSTAIHV